MTVLHHYPNPFSSISPLPMASFQSILPEPMFALLLFLLSFSLVSLAGLTFSLYLRVREEKLRSSSSSSAIASSSSSSSSSSISFASSSSGSSSTSVVQRSPPAIVDKTVESTLTHLAHSLLIEILSTNSPIRETPPSDELPEAAVSELSLIDKENVDSSGEESDKKNKKKGKKKQTSSPDLNTEEEQLKLKEMADYICSFPLPSSLNALQKKIKQQFLQHVESIEAKGLTTSQQAGKFVNHIIEFKSELEQRSDTNQRKLTIAKALLHKAHRSTIDRLHQQIYKLELDQKRLEEDIFVYDWLQQQLKLSLAFKKIQEVAAGTEPEVSRKPEEVEQIADADFGVISFEEFLAQEKKDSFWQKHRKY